METRAQINKCDGYKDAAAPDIASDILSRITKAVTQAMTTTISNATIPVYVTPKTITFTSSIDP